MKYLQQYIGQVLTEQVEQEDIKLIQAFLDQMSHGIHLADALGKTELLKVFEEIHAEANGLLEMWEGRDVNLGPPPGQISFSNVKHWKKHFQKIRSLLRDDLWGNYIKFDEVVHAVVPVYDRLVDTINPFRLNKEYADWFYEWVGRDQP